MTNAVIPVILGDGPQLVAGGVDTGEVRRRFQTGTIFDAFNDAVRTVTLAGVRTLLLL